MRILITIACIAFSLTTHAQGFFGQETEPVTIEAVSENKLQTTLFLKEAGVTLKLPKTWNLSSPSLVFEQKGLDELKTDVLKKLDLTPTQEQSIILGLTPKKTDGLIRLYCNRKSEWFDSNSKLSFDDLLSHSSIEICFLPGKNAEILAQSFYVASKEMIKADTKATISAELQPLTINRMTSFHYKLVQFSSESFYFVQVDGGVLAFICTNFRSTTNKQLKELDQIIARIEKKT